MVFFCLLPKYLYLIVIVDLFGYFLTTYTTYNFFFFTRPSPDSFSISGHFKRSLCGSGHSAIRFRTHGFVLVLPLQLPCVGLTLEDIKRLGRWKMDAFMLYISSWFFACLGRMGKNGVPLSIADSLDV